MMKRRPFTDMQCSVAQSLEVVGEWWTLLIMRDALVGVRRFEHFQKRLGISRNVLAARLDALVDHGLLRRERYQDRPPRDEYRLTDKGRALWPVLNSLRQWGDEWIVGKESVTLELVHESCGNRIIAEQSCSSCHQPLDVHEMHFEPGPGAVDGDPYYRGPAPRKRSGARRR